VSRSRTSPEGGERLLVILTAPSGTGKTTVASQVLRDDDALSFSVSHTTRPIRDGEADGVDYHYVDDEAFDAMVAAGAFAEWAHVHKRRYGTSHAEIARIRDGGHDVLLDIDPQGGVQLMATYPNAVTIFMAPPSMDELGRRLRGRGTEGEEQLSVRLGVARDEIAYAPKYSYLVINDEVERAAGAIASIITAERARTGRNEAMIASLRHEEESS
jgi:guanylate kinase